ncbi:glycosyltransferase [Marinomonas sp. S3726]|uniref:MJ1255/VC2487 family glycosyltransferase n=1 Tax=Marinomonas sp. S3726 TaxID=579484 RepID=UPI0005FA9399|nr:MJ1255/VC2487 family glycosyltransferase [Marinomonas sp. S3726]KJZ13907.1 glycosyltransferase [Marinomonas sp. S3726]
MKIFYGVQGTGNGHISRARVLAKAFNQRDDIEVDYLFTGRDSDKYFDMQVFGNYQTRQGLSFKTENGTIAKWKTLQSFKPNQFFNDIKALDLTGYDLVLNDFEPISAWAAKKQKIPSIAISHQAAFLNPIPQEGNFLYSQLLLKQFAPCDIKLGVHYYHFGHPIIPPFVDDQGSDERSEKDILVYFPFENLKEIRRLLLPFTGYRFHCFHPELKQDFDQGHIHWRKTSKEGFHEKLVSCGGVIANGGFELSSECLKLGKKLLIKPLHGQFEQYSNIVSLQKMGLCHTMPTLDSDSVKAWLTENQPEAVGFQSDPALLIDWIVSKEWHNTKNICQQLWKNVHFPTSVKNKLGIHDTKIT